MYFVVFYLFGMSKLRLGLIGTKSQLFYRLRLTASLTITNDEISAVVGLVKLAVSSYLAPLETCLRLISRFEQSGRQKVIHRIFQ